MKRGTPRKSGTKPTLENKVQVYSDFMRRMKWMGMGVGDTFGGKRNVSDALGYPVSISYREFYHRFKRQSMAKAVINRPVNATWRGGFTVTDTKNPQEQTILDSLKDLQEEFKLSSILRRADRLACIGMYSVLLFGWDDVRSIRDFEKPVAPGARKLLYLKPYSQEGAMILESVNVETDPRYGLPLFYQISMGNMMDSNIAEVAPGQVQSTALKVHHSRVLHIVHDSLESEIFGIPALEGIYNLLLDLEKVAGGAAEMFWRGARPGYQGKVAEGFQITADDRATLESQIDEFEHHLRRFMVNEGIEISSLQQQIASPEAQVKVIMQLISAATGIPVRVLTGSERGELASTQDKDSWIDNIAERRDEYAEPHVVRPFLQTLVKYKLIPPLTRNYTISWTDLYSPSVKEQAEIAFKRAQALQLYTNSPGSDILVPPELFLRDFLGMSEDLIAKYINLVEVERKLEERFDEEEDDLVDDLNPSGSLGM